MPTLGELVVTLTLSNKKFSKNMEQARQGTLDFGTALTRVSQSMASVFVSAMSAATAAVTAFGTATVKTGKDFEYAMTEVAAISGATSAELERLTEKSRELGGTTMFTATQAAQGMGELARTGLKTTSILRATGDALNFAGANSSSVAQSAKMLSSTMAQFNIAAFESKRITDVFTTSIQNSLMDVNALQSSLKYGGSIAGAFGHSLEETTAALSLFRNLGLEGSTAGVRFRQAMLSLAKPTEGAEKTLKKYGLTVDDVNPKMHSFADIMTTLGKKQISLGDMVSLVSKRAAGDVQKIATEFANGTTKFGDLLNKMQKSAGVTEKTYKKFVNTVAGQSMILGSALQETYITLFEPVKPIIKSFLGFTTSILQNVSETLNSVPTLLSQTMENSFGILASGTDSLKDTITVAVIEIILSIDNIIAKMQSWWPTIKATATFLMNAFPYVAIATLSMYVGAAAVAIGTTLVTALASARAAMATFSLTATGLSGILGTLRAGFMALSVAARANLVGALLTVVGTIAYYVSSAKEATAATYDFERSLKAAQIAQQQWDAYLKNSTSNLSKVVKLRMNKLKLQLAQQGKLTNQIERQIDAVANLTQAQRQQLLSEGKLIGLNMQEQGKLTRAVYDKVKASKEALEVQRLGEIAHHREMLYNTKNAKVQSLRAQQQKKYSKRRAQEITKTIADMNKLQSANRTIYQQIGTYNKTLKQQGIIMNETTLKLSNGVEILYKDAAKLINANGGLNSSFVNLNGTAKVYRNTLLPLHTALVLAKTDQANYGHLVKQVTNKLYDQNEQMKLYTKGVQDAEQKISTLSTANELILRGEKEKALELLRTVNYYKAEKGALTNRITVLQQAHQQLMINNKFQKDFNLLSKQSRDFLLSQNQAMGGFMKLDPAWRARSKALKEEIEVLKQSHKNLTLYAVDLAEVDKGIVGSKSGEVIKKNMESLSAGHGALNKLYESQRKMVQGMNDEWEIALDMYKTNQQLQRIQQKKTTKSTKKLTGKIVEQRHALERLIRNYERTLVVFRDLDKQIKSQTLSKYNQELRKLSELYSAAVKEADKYLQKAIDLKKQGRISTKLLVAAENKALSQRIVAAKTAADNQTLYAQKTNKIILRELKELNSDVTSEYLSIGQNQISALKQQNKESQTELNDSLNDYKAFYDTLLNEQNNYIAEHYKLLRVQAKRDIKNKTKLNKRIKELDEQESKALAIIAQQQLKFKKEAGIKIAEIEQLNARKNEAIIKEYHKKQLEELQKQYSSLLIENSKYESTLLLAQQKAELKKAKLDQQSNKYIEQLKQNHLLQLRNLQGRYLSQTINQYGTLSKKILGIEKKSIKSRLEPLSEYYLKQAEFMKQEVKLQEEHNKIIKELMAKTADGQSGVSAETVAEVRKYLKQIENLNRETYEKEVSTILSKTLEKTSKFFVSYIKNFGKLLSADWFQPLALSAYNATNGIVELSKKILSIRISIDSVKKSSKDLSLKILDSAKSFIPFRKRLKEIGPAIKDIKDDYGTFASIVSSPFVAIVKIGQGIGDWGDKLKLFAKSAKEAIKGIDFKVIAIKAKAIAKEIYKYSSIIIKSIGSIVSSMAKSLISLGSKVSSYLTGGMSLNPLEILSQGVSEITDILEQEAADTSDAEQAIADARKKFAEGRISASELAEAEKEYEYQKSQAEEGEDPKTAKEAASDFVDNLIQKVLTMIDTIIEVGPVIIEKFIQKLPQVFSAIAKAIPTLLRVIMQQLPNLIIAIIDGFVAAIPDMITTFVSYFPLMVNKLITIIQEKLPQLIQVLAEGVLVVIQTLGAAIPELLDSIFQPAEEGGKSLFQTLIEGLTNAIVAIIQQLPTIIASIMKQLPTIVQTLLSSIGDIAAAFIEAVPSILTAIIESLPTLIQALVEGVLTLVTKVIEALPQLIEYIVQLLPQIIQTIVEMIPKIVTALVNKLPSLLTSIIQLLPTLIEGIVMLIPELIVALVAALPDLIIALVNGIVQLFTKPEIIGQIIYALTVGLAQALINAAYEFIKVLGRFFADVITEIISFGTTETKTFGDTPQPIKAGSDGLMARFAPNDYVIAAQKPKDVLSQALSLFGGNMGEAVNKIAAPKPLIQSPEQGGMSSGSVIDIAVVAEGKLLSNIQVDAMNKGKAPKLKRKFQKASGATVGFNRGRYNKFGT